MKKLSIFSAQKYFYFVYLLIRCEYLTHFINNFNKTYAYLISFLQQMSIILCSLWYNCYLWQSHMNGNDLDFLNKFGKVHINKNDIISFRNYLTRCRQSLPSFSKLHGVKVLRSQSSISTKIMKNLSKNARLDAFMPSFRYMKWQSGSDLSVKHYSSYKG